MSEEKQKSGDRNVEVILKNVRLSFENVWEPKVYRNKKTNDIEGYAYECNLLLDKDADKAQIDIVRAAMRETIAKTWGSNPPTIPAENRCLRDGEIVDPDTNEKKPRWTGYDNKVYVSAKRRVDGPETPNPVQLLDGVKGADGKFIRLKKSDGKMYAGVYVDAILRVYGYDGQKDGNPNRVNASLEALKFRRHGEAFGNAPVDADSRFEENEPEDGFGETSTSKPAPADDDLL